MVDWCCISINSRDLRATPFRSSSAEPGRKRMRFFVETVSDLHVGSVVDASSLVMVSWMLHVQIGGESGESVTDLNDRDLPMWG